MLLGDADDELLEGQLSFSQILSFSSSLRLEDEVELTMAASPHPMPSNFSIVICTMSSLAAAPLPLLLIGWKIPPLSTNQFRNNSPFDFVVVDGDDAGAVTTSSFVGCNDDDGADLKLLMEQQ